MNLRADIYKIAGLVVAIVIGSFLLSALIPNHSSRILSLMMVLVSVTVFYGFMGLGIGHADTTLSKPDVRLAIMVATLTTFFVLVGTVSFFNKGSAPPPITDTMLTHFTNVVMVVIVFYFGAEAYITVNNPVKRRPGQGLE